MTAIRTRYVLPLALAAGLILPTGADAATFCVSDPECPAGATSYNNLQSALTAARNNSQGDTVRVGAGTYEGKFTYDNNQPLEVIGAGRGATILRNAGAAALDLQADQTVVKNLRIESDFNYVAVLRRGHLDGVTVSGNGDNQAAVLARGGSTIKGSTLISETGSALYLDDDSVTDTTTVSDSTLLGVGWGVRNGGSGEPLRAELISNQIQAQTPVLFYDGNLTLRSSVLRSTPGGTVGLDVGGSATVKAEHLTIDGQGNGDGVSVTSDSLSESNVTITSSIITRYARGFNRKGNGNQDANIDSRYTLFLGREDSGGGAFNATANPPWAAPPFVNPSALFPNHHLMAPSSLIDGGEPGVGANQLDAGGDPRVIDGNGSGGAQPDIGAYEYQRAAPVATITAPTQAAPGQPVTFTAAATDADQTETGKLTYAWDLAGTTAPGKQVTQSFATPGLRTVTLTVSDPGGRVTQVNHQIVVIDPSAGGGNQGGQGGGGGQGGTGGQAGTGGGGTQGSLLGRRDTRDRTAPRLARFGASAKRLRVGRTVSTRTNRRRGGQLRLRLSEPATVKVTFERKRGKRYRKARGSVTIKGTAGLNRIVFAGRLSRKQTLAPGMYRVTAVATDATGNRSKAQRTTITLVR